MPRPLACLCLCLCLVSPPAARGAAVDWGGNLSLSSDNLLRGTSRSSSDPALAGELHVQHDSGWFGSVWTSTSRIRPTDPTTVDIAATLGFSAALTDDWSLRGAYAHYESPWQNFSGFYTYDEFTADLRYRESLLLSVSYSPNTSRFGEAYGPVFNRTALAYEASWQLPLRGALRFSAGLGYYDLTDLFGTGYWYGSAGLNWSSRRWRLEAAYVMASDRATEVSYVGDGGQRALFSVGYFFD